MIEIYSGVQSTVLRYAGHFRFDKGRLTKDCFIRQDPIKTVNGMIMERGREQRVGLIH